MNITLSFFKGILKPVTSYRNNEHFRLAVYLVIASVPAGITGIFFKKHIESAFENPLTVAVSLLITGIL